MNISLFISLIAIMCVFFGWGIIARFLFRLHIPDGFMPALGVVLLLFIGGMLLALAAATAENLIVLSLIGFVAFGTYLFRVIRPRCHPDKFPVVTMVRDTLREARPYAAAAFFLVLLFVIHHQPSVLNLSDDLEKYAKYPVRMLTTGKITSGPFDSMGSEVLGGMSYLQGFALMFGRSLFFINVIDTVVATFLAMCIIVSLFKYMGRDWRLCLLFSSLIPMIDPLYVNTSANYMGTLVFLLIFALPLLNQTIEEGFSAKHILVLGMAYAALIALKTSLALLIPIHFCVYLPAALLFSPKRRFILLRSPAIPAATFLFAFPWFFIHWEKYRLILRQAFIGSFFSDRALPGITQPSWRPFSMRRVLFGFDVTDFHYSLLVVMCILLTAIILFSRGYSRLTAWVSVSMCGSMTLAFIIGQGYAAPRVVGFDSGLRYLVPMLIACTILFGMVIEGWRSDPATSRSRRYLKQLPVVLLFVGLILFMPSMFARCRQAAKLGNALAVPAFANGHYVDYIRTLMHEKRKMQFIQDLIPVNARTLVWILTPFQLDFRRNDLVDVDVAGFSNPWLLFPFQGQLDYQVTYLKKEGITYIMWQYAGRGIQYYSGRGIHLTEHIERSVGDGFPRRRVVYFRTLLFVRFLDELSRNRVYSTVIFDDGQVRILHIH